MTTKEISKSIILKYGSLLGLVSVSMSFGLYTQNRHLEQSQAIGLISISFILAAIILGIRAFAKENKISFGEGLKIGIGITVVGAIILTFYNYIFSHYIEPDFIDQMIVVQKKAMEASGQLNAEEITARIEKLKEGADSFITSAIGIVFSAFLGFVFSAVTTVVFIKINESKNQD